MRASPISGTTRVCGIIGEPVQHSLSPAMHNAAFAALGLDYVYVPFHVAPDKLEDAIRGVRACRIRGLNVTVPHKVAVMLLLDAIDDLAREIVAVNTIVNDGGHLTGYNTDAAGFLQALVESGFDAAGKTVTVIGAGGAARAITYALARSGAVIVILNRSPSKASELAERVSLTFKSSGNRAAELSEQNLRAALAESELVVNTTSVGMSPNRDETPVPAALLQPGHTVFDIVYSPVQTRLLREAAGRGARTVTGLDMLVYQGAAAFEKWTGRKAPVSVMKKALLECLHEN